MTPSPRKPSQNPLVNPLLLLVAVEQKRIEVVTDYLLFWLLIGESSPSSENPAEEKALSNGQIEVRERRANFTDPTGLEASEVTPTTISVSQTGYSMGPGDWRKVVPNQAVIMVTYSGETNENGAQKATLSVYTAEQVGPSGYVNLSSAPAVSVPAVSGATNVAPTPKGTYSNLKTESVSTSSEPILKDAAHGGANNTMVRLPNTNGDAVHQGNNGADQTRAYSAGCVTVTTVAGSGTTPAQNYEEVKGAVGGGNVTVIVR